ncbi:hypothetical protein AVEN_259823-1 [Araneus ventricosus]|uniref:Uncharacterized protein n=1 Tax=Araneus ventricosus TaxID=182803 RepID=A0A4Y2I4G4_ARAVE|nr:hypothetical protein AVEN_259823-1 [Araneus ventricosus]
MAETNSSRDKSKAWDLMQVKSFMVKLPPASVLWKLEDVSSSGPDHCSNNDAHPNITLLHLGYINPLIPKAIEIKGPQNTETSELLYQR